MKWENVFSDLKAGFFISLLALPLSLGIAQAGGEPAFAGVVGAIVSTIVFSFFKGTSILISGPAAGLISVLLADVTELGRLDLFFISVLVAGLIQFLFYLFKAERFMRYIPALVIEGMFGGIGLIILMKQSKVILGQDWLSWFGFWETPLKYPVLLTGIFSLLVAFLSFHPKLKNFPVPLLVVILGVMSGSFLQSLGAPWQENDFIQIHKYLNDFAILNPLVFFHTDFVHEWLVIKNALIIALVGSFESLLTAQGMASQAPSDQPISLRQTLLAQSLANMLIGLFQGVPVIAEVVRSKANVVYGARSRWANSFHGLFLLAYILLLTHFVEMIPLASLAALLIVIGIRLMNFKGLLSLARENLLGASLSIFVTLVVAFWSLLIGVFVGAILFYIFRRSLAHVQLEH
jgi:MFS superfamily sulfate permease-like transporter